MSADDVANPQVWPTETEYYMLYASDSDGRHGGDTVIVYVEPSDPVIAHAGEDFSVTAGESFTLGDDPAATGGTPPYEYYWQPSDPIISSPTGPNPHARIEEPTTFVLRVTDSEDNIDYDTVTVSIIPDLVANAGADRYIIEGDTINIGGHPAVTGGTPPYNIEWAPSDDISDPGAENPDVWPPATRQYSLFVEDNEGRFASDTMMVFVEPLDELVADAGESQIICRGDEIILGGYPPAEGGRPPYTFEWTPTEGLSDPTDFHPIATPFFTTTYMLTVTDSRGDFATSEVTLTVDCVEADAGEDVYVCPGSDIEIGGDPTARGGLAPYEYTWSPSVGISDIHDPNPTVSPSHDQTYVVRVQDAAGNVAWDTVQASISLGHSRLNCFFGMQQIDIVFVLDTTGSMSSELREITENLMDFVTDLEESEFDYHLGGVTFGDGENIWDFDPGTPGNQMTDDAETMRDQLATTGATGGGDGPETSLDAMAMAIEDYEWRPEATHVLLMVTDATYHYRGDGLGISEWTDVELYELAISQGPIIYSITRGPEFYDTLSIATGGNFYRLTEPDWVDVFPDIVDDIYAENDISVELTNCSGGLCTYTGEFISDDEELLEVVSTNPYLTEPVENGHSVTLPWEVNYRGMGDTICYKVVVTGCASVDTFSGCMSYEGCLNLSADAGPDLYVDYGDTVYIGGTPAASGGAPPYNYFWTEGIYLDDPNLANPRCIPEATTRYVLVVADIDGEVAYDDVTVYVTDPSPIIVDAGPDTTVMRGSELTLGGEPTAMGGSGVFTYFWTPATGLSDREAENPTATVYSTTTYIVYVEDTEGRSGQDTVVVTVEYLPELLVDAGPDQYIILGDSVAVGGSPTAVGGLGPYDYRWSPGAFIEDIYLSNPMVYPVVTTSYTVNVNDATDMYGSDVVTIYVSVPDSLVAHAGDNREIEPGESTILGDVPAATGGTPPYTFSWSPEHWLDDPDIANPSATPGTTITYTLTVTDADGATDTGEVMVILPVAPPLRAYAGPDMEKDADEPMEIGTIPAASGGYPPYTYSWTPSADLTGADTETPISRTDTTTEYTLTVTDLVGNTATDRMILTVTDPFELVADAGADYYIDAGGSVRIGGSPTASGGELPYSFVWSPSSYLSFPTNPNPTAAPPVTTTFTVTVEDNSGAIATDEMTVYVEELPPPFTVDAGPDREIMLGEEVVIGGSPTVTGGVDPIDIEWIGPWLVDGHTENPTASPETTTIYIVNAVENIGRERSDTMIVTVNEEPPTLLADAGEDRTIMLGDMTTLGGYPAAVGGTPPYTYSWMPHPELGDLLSAHPEAWPSVTTTFTLTVMDYLGNTASDDVTVTVEEELPELIVDAGPDVTIEAGESIEIGGSPTVTGGIYPVEIEWTGADLDDPSIANPTASPMTTRMYIVNVTDGEGRTGTDTMYVYVEGGPLWAEAGEERVISLGDTITLGGSPTAGGGVAPYTYEWSGHPGSISDETAANPLVWPEYASVYYVNVIDFEGTSAWDSVWIFIEDFLPEFWVDAGPDTAIYLGESVTLGGSPTVNGYHWSYELEWSGPGIDGSTEDNPIVSPIEDAMYIVTATDRAGRTDTDTVYVEVIGAPPLIAEAGPAHYITTGDTVQLGGDPVAMGGTPPYNYVWTNYMIDDNRIEHPHVWPNVTRRYTVHVTDDMGRSAYDSVYVYVEEGFAVDAGEDRTISLGDTTLLGGEVIATGGTPPYMFFWEPVYNISDPTAEHPEAWPTVDTFYILTGLDSEMRSASDTVRVFMDDPGDSVYVRVTSTVPADDFVYRSLTETFQMWEVESDEGREINPMSIAVLNGFEEYWYEPGDPYLTYADGTVSFINPDLFSLSSGDTVLYSLLRCADFAGNELLAADINNIWIIYDFDPPELDGVYPAHGSTVLPGDITIAGSTVDALSGVDGDLTKISVNGVTFDSSHPAFFANDEGFTLDYPATLDEEVLHICAYMIDYSQPEPNDTWECWDINVSEEAPGSGPFVSAFYPEDGALVSCNPVEMGFTLIDTSGIDLETVRFGVSIDGSADTLWPSVYSASVMVQYIDYGINVKYTAPPAMHDIGRIGLRVTEAEDFHGNALDAPVAWNVEYDVVAPVLSMLYPTPGGGAPTAPDSIGINITDNYAGINLLTLQMDVMGTVFDIDHPALTYNPITGDLAFDPSEAGFALPDSGIMTVSVQVEDATSMCKPNISDTSWVFYIGMAVEEWPELPEGLSLLGNRPNPFNASTDIVFQTEGGYITMEIYTVTGERIQTVDMGDLRAGVWSYTFDGRDIPTGIYFYSVTNGKERQTGRMMLVK